MALEISFAHVGQSSNMALEISFAHVGQSSNMALEISFAHVGQSSNVAIEVSLTQVRTVIKCGHGVGIIPSDDEETVGEGGQGGVTAGGCSETANHLLTCGLAHRHAGVSHRDRG